MTTCVVDNSSALLRSVGLKKSAPSTAAMKHPPASRARSRPVRAPVESGCVRSAHVGSEASLINSPNDLRDRTITPA
jgi:hypothetical protein